MNETVYNEDEIVEIKNIKIALVEHPVSMKLKNHLKSKGLRIIDIKHKDRIDPALVAEIVVKEKADDKDNDGLKDKDPALEALRDEAKALGMTGFGRLGVEKLAAAIEAKKAE